MVAQVQVVSILMIVHGSLGVLRGDEGIQRDEERP
jgi:hypothetical protein